MALPKRKHSKARRDKSRTHWKLRVSGMSRCAQCGKPVASHRLCPSCGFYRGRQIVAIKAKPEKKRRTSS